MTSRGRAGTWKFESLRTSVEREASLVASWEVAQDHISGDFDPLESTPNELFTIWAESVHREYQNDLIQIYWSVRSPEVGIFETMPFQFKWFATREDFLTFYTWPLEKTTGDQLNWLTLPVENKLWNSDRADKGGFIQQATGWKPAVLQPYVYLPSLLSSQQ